MNATLVSLEYPVLSCPHITQAYRESAERNVLAALNPDVFFGYFSVCANGIGHGNDTTFPALDWGQTVDALLWLGRRDEVLASWDYVSSFQNEDGMLPIAVMPGHAGRTIRAQYGYSMQFDERGALWTHWWPGNPLLTLANVTFLQTADTVFRHTGDKQWLEKQMPLVKKAADWLLNQITEKGLVKGASFYTERPTRMGFDGINQCATFHAFHESVALFGVAGETHYAQLCSDASQRIREGFAKHFWAQDHCVEYIHPERGPISHHGLTDVDWAALATGILSQERTSVVWEQLRDASDFIYDGVPTGIATRPETYEDWEMENLDRHDVSAMGRVWYYEARARFLMGDTEGLMESLRLVARKGEANGWSWMERYYSERTGDLGEYHFDTYLEYPVTLIRIVHRFVLRDDLKLPGANR